MHEKHESRFYRTNRNVDDFDRMLQSLESECDPRYSLEQHEERLDGVDRESGRLRGEDHDP